MKKIIFLIFICAQYGGLYSQNFNKSLTKEFIISLKTVNGDSSWFQQSLSLRAVDSSANFVMPSGYKNYKVWTVVLNRAQEYYERLREGKMSAAEFKELPKLYNIDTAKLFKGKLQGNRINVFTAIDSANKYIIIDANNNSSFLDDKRYAFPFVNRDVREHVNVLVARYDGKLKSTFLVPVTIEPFQNGADSRELEIELIAGSMRLGKVQINNKTYLIGFNNRNFGLESSNNIDYTVNIREVPVNENDVNEYNYLPYYDLDIGGSLYHIKKVTDGQLVMDFVKKLTDGGGRVGELAPAIEMPDVVTSKTFRLNLNSGKYTIIDFWGSWCVPCIEAMPMLVSAHDKYSAKINFVNIALEYNKDINKLKGVIAAHNLNWPQLWVDRHKIKNSVIYDYKVGTYPTTILLDKNGKIIFRGVGVDGLQHVLNVIDDKLAESN